MSNPSVVENNLPQVMGMLLMHKVFYLVGKDRISEIPGTLQGHTSFANEELLSAIGTPLRKLREEVFVFSEERGLYRGIAKLKTRDKLKEYELVSVTSPPALLFQKFLQLKPTTVHVDYGMDTELDIPGAELAVLERLLVIAGMAKVDKVFILQDRSQYAIEMTLEDDKRYALAFLTEEDSLETMETLGDESPGCTPVENNMRQVVEGVLKSSLEGLLINPASSSQQTLTRSDLEALRIGVNVAKGEKFSVGGFFKALFSPPQRK